MRPKSERNVLSEREHRKGFSFRRVEASPDDPMFGRLHVAFWTPPQEATEGKPCRPEVEPPPEPLD
jgi:hypothetical protein